MDLRACGIKGFVKRVRFDENLYHSLIKSSSKKLKSQKMLNLDDDTASSKISLTYDSLRELLEALAISKGLKIYNHECYTAFLKEVMNESYLGDKFDAFRKARNDINYYGKDVSATEAKHMIEAMITFIESLKSKLFKK